MAEPRIVLGAALVVLDLAGLAGAGLVVFGAWQVFHPAGFIVGGGFALVGRWLLARRGI